MPPSPESSCASPPCSANLSDSYFTNRQDRYVFLQDCPEIADFFTELVDAVGDVSLQLQGDDSVQVVEGMVHPYKGRAPGSAASLVCGRGARGQGEPAAGGLATRLGRLGWQSPVLLLSLKPDRGDSLAVSHAVPAREGVSVGFGPVRLGGCAVSRPRIYRKQLCGDCLPGASFTLSQGGLVPLSSIEVCGLLPGKGNGEPSALLVGDGPGLAARVLGARHPVIPAVGTS